MQDRERFYALPHISDTQHSIHSKNPPNPPPGGGCASITSGGTLKVSSLNLLYDLLKMINPDSQ